MRSATWEAMGEVDGRPSHRLLNYITSLARGEVGLILPGAVFCTSTGENAAHFSGLSTREHADAWRRTIDRVHEAGSRLVFQVSHPGLFPGPGGGFVPKVPSADLAHQHELTNADIESVIEQFAKSAALAHSAGADGVQVHAAHGYLLSSFLSADRNRRTDKWGGPAEGRVRIVREIARQIRKAVPATFSVSVKLNGADFHAGGVVPEQAAEHVRLLKDALDFFEISGGTTMQYTIRTTVSERVLAQAIRDPAQRAATIRKAHSLVTDVPFSEMHFRPQLKVIRKVNADANLALVGGNRTFAAMEELIKSGDADVVSISRPLFHEPELIKRFRLGTLDRSGCINCSSCIIHSDAFGNICRFRDPTKNG
jgi:2,4-dienoyl-CoA reductase-like NADH-dependent reductase (Old Yellow Enzyme family)